MMSSKTKEDTFTPTIEPSALEAGQGETCALPWWSSLRSSSFIFGRRQHTMSAEQDESRNAESTTDPEYLKKIGPYRLGYPMLAAFMNLDPAFMNCRSFGVLHARVLLYKQDELSELETKLNELDKSEPKQLHLSSRRRGDENEKRKTLMTDISQKIEEYGRILQSQYFLSRIPLTNQRNFESFEIWMERIAPLVDPEDGFLQYRNDFVTLTPKGDQGWLERSIEHLIDKLPAPARQFFSPDNENLKTDDPTLHIFRRQRVGSLVRYLNATFAVILLVPPVIVLHQVNKDAVGLSILVGFTWAFSMSMSIFTKARKHEVFAATAAYCAVLVVFFGNSTLQSIQTSNQSM